MKRLKHLNSWLTVLIVLFVLSLLSIGIVKILSLNSVKILAFMAVFQCLIYGLRLGLNKLNNKKQ